MPTYLLSVHASDDTMAQPMTDEEMRAGFAVINAIEAELRAAGAFVFGGRLDDPSRARVARPTRTRVRTTDGPFAETKEHLGGFYIIEAGDLGAALGWASRVALAINSPIEVRSFFGVSG